jgi:transcriptional regulator with XRE-family HTH domain
MTKQGGWPPSGFSARLKAEREKAGLTQKQLAEKAGCNVFTVAKLERGSQEPAWPLVLALAKALGVDCTAFGDGPAVQLPPTPAKGPPPAPEPSGVKPRGRAGKKK